MGITIFAWGRIERINDIPRLIDELKGIAKERGWEYHVIDDDFDAHPDAVLTQCGSSGAVIEGSLGVKGIVLNMDKGVEPLAFLFDRTGVLTDMPQQLAWIENDRQGDRFTALKTQFGNIETHVRIIELLDRLKQKYVSNLVVNDEGGYWTSRDRRLLAEKRIFLSQCLRHVEKAIGGIEVNDDERRNAAALADRIEDALRKADREDRSNQ